MLTNAFNDLLNIFRTSPKYRAGVYEECVVKLKQNQIVFKELKDNIPHNTCQIYVKPHSKNTQMTLEYHIFDEKALE